MTWYTRYGKRAFDCACVIATLPLTVPLCVVVLLVARWYLGPSILYRQVRPGLGGKPFTLFKIRTMTEARDAAGAYMPDSVRLTRVGKVLRAASLDEFTTLWNVLLGDMSLVGPRPLLMEYLPLYDAEQARRHDVRPGITGWAQVHGRNASSWEERLRLDVWYARHLSFLLDLRILALTVRTVLRRGGVSAEGHATMPRFTGTRKSEPTS